MVWKTPQTEQEWSECLSTYLDGEMNAEDRAALEAALRTDPERFAQLEAYRQTSSVLQGWNVDAPEPSPAFMRQIQEADREKREPFWKRFLFPNIQWFQFSMGVVTGVFALAIVQYVNQPSATLSTTPVNTQNGAQPVYNVFISQNQAESLMGEVTAAGLVSQMKTQLRNGQWDEAASTYQTLLDDHSDAKAFVEIKNSPAVQTFIKKFVKTRSV